MAVEPSDAQRRLVQDTVRYWLLVEAWRFIALQAHVPADAIAAAERAVSDRFDAFLAASPPEMEFMRHLAADEMATFWQVVRLVWPSRDGAARPDAPGPARDPWHAPAPRDRQRYRWRKAMPLR